MCKYKCTFGNLKGRSFTLKQLNEVYRDTSDREKFPVFQNWFDSVMETGEYKEVDSE